MAPLLFLAIWLAEPEIVEVHVRLVEVNQTDRQLRQVIFWDQEFDRAAREWRAIDRGWRRAEDPAIDPRRVDGKWTYAFMKGGRLYWITADRCVWTWTVGDPECEFRAAGGWWRPIAR